MGDTTTEQLEQIQQIWNIIVNFLVNYSFQLLGAIFVFLLGLMVTKRVAKAVLNLCQNKNLDVTLSQFISSVVKIILLTMIAIICLNMIGISVTPFVAAIGALGLGAGLAVQGLLSNFGAGFNIILSRPFVVGDTIKVQGEVGIVKEVKLAHTMLVNEDGVEIMVPNRHIVGETLHNSKKYSLFETSVGVAYSSDLDTVLTVLKTAFQDHELIAEHPSFQVGIGQLAESSVDIELRFWVLTEKLFESKYQLNKLIWDTLKAHNIDMPFPQREVTLHKQVTI